MPYDKITTTAVCSNGHAVYILNGQPLPKLCPHGRCDGTLTPVKRRG